MRTHEARHDRRRAQLNDARSRLIETKMPQDGTRIRMIKRFMLASMITTALVGASIGAWSGPAFGAASCAGMFAGTVDHGADVGLTVQGRLVMSVAEDGT